MTGAELIVTAVDDSVPGIRTLTLAAPDGSALPTFVPGSHVVVMCDGRANAYSLTGPPLAPSAYTISVLRIEDGAGGSRWLHDEVAVGSRVEVQLPRSAFPPVSSATRHLLIAGGIGVTPIVSHLRAARRWGRDVQVLYAFRAGRGAYVDEIKELADDRVEFFTDRAGFVERLATALTEQPIGTHLYVCGPNPMTDHVLDTATALGWPQSRLHSERFGLDVLDPGDPFTVTLSRTGVTLDVPSGTSLLASLEAAGVAVPNLCRQGVCGECRIPVAAGTPLHRDLYLTDEEKEAGDTLMCCVSRAHGPHLEVPL